MPQSPKRSDRRTFCSCPSTEPFSFVATQHTWVEQQWLYEALLASLVRLGGDGLASLVLGLAGKVALLVIAMAVPRSARISRGPGVRPPCSSAA